MKIIKPVCLLILLCLITLNIHAKAGLTLDVEDEELTIDRYPAEGDELVVFISAGMGLPERVRQVSAGVAQLGIEFWHIDLAENLFLPKSTSTFRALDGRVVAGLITQAHQLTGKNVTLMSHAYASLPALRGVHRWQQQQGSSLPSKADSIYLNGLILLSPDLYMVVPELGLEPVFAPISAVSNVPVMIFQSGQRSNRWQLEKLVSELRKGGAQVYSKIFPGVTGVFYGEDTAPETLALIKTLPSEAAQAIRLLAALPTPLNAPPFTEKKLPAAALLDMELRPFKGDPLPPGLDLFNVDGDRVVHKDYRGNVTVVNFWASWCHPCIEEIPSLNRLREQMKGLKFVLISVDYAEDRDEIIKFLQEVNVDFPVLLDSDGTVSAGWNVLVFPSTFVIAPNGNIVYGVRGGLQWDSPEIVRQLKALLDTQ